MEFGSGNAECGKENLEWGRRMRDEGGRGKIEGGRLRGWEGEKVSRWRMDEGGWRQWNSELGMRNAEKKRKSEAVGKGVEKMRG
jgi:hypothetical protein